MKMPQEKSSRGKSKAANPNRKNRRGSPAQGRELQYGNLELRQLLAALYVDNTGGSNSNDGLSLGSAFETIQAAATVAQPGDTVNIRGGVYRETVTVPRSGSASSPITFQAYNNEEVILSGGDLVTGWTQHDGDIWKATVNWNAGNNRDNNTLFVDGELKLEARQGAENNFFDINDWGVLPRGRLVDGASSFRVDDLTGYANDYWNGAKVRFHTFDYIVDTRTIADFASDGTITLDSAVGNTEQKQDNGYYIYDTLKAVDQAGEWFKDTGNTLYYHVDGGDGLAELNNLEIELKRRAYAFDVRGRDHIHLDGLEFRGASVQTNGSTDHNVYRGNQFYAYDKGNFGGFAISGDNNTLRDNEFSYTWRSFVGVGGTRNAIVNNYIHHIGLRAATRVISATSAEELLISHNTVTTFARSFLDGYPSRSEISYNVFEQGGLLTWDTGVIDSDGGNGNSSGSVFHHNVFRNTNTRGIFETFYGRNNNAVIHHNLIHDFNTNSSRTILRANGTDFRHVYHNTLISGVNAAPNSVFGTAPTIQARYNNNVQITTDRVEALGVDIRGNRNYQTSDFVDFAGKDFQLASGSPAIDSGIVLPGVNDGYLGSAPDAGAFESGQAAWTAGHDFINPPTPVYSWVALPGTNLYDNGQFLQGIGDWITVSGTPTSLNRNSWNLQQSGAGLTGTFRTESVEFTPGESIRQVFTGLKPNTVYTLGANARLVNRVTNGNVFNSSSGSVSTGSHRSEGYATDLQPSEWVRYNNIDFGASGQFNQIDLLHIRDPSDGFANIGNDVRVQVRLDGPTGTLLGEFTDIANGNIGDRWRANRADFTQDVSGLHDLYLSVTGTNGRNLALGSLRLLNSEPSTSDLLTVAASSPGAQTITAQIGNEDWYAGYDEISFKTGPSATTAEIRFENSGRLNAYLDRFYVLEGYTTRGGTPRAISSTAIATRSLSATTSGPANSLLDGLLGTTSQTGDHTESWVQVDLDEVAEVHSITLSPAASSPASLSNFQVSVWSSDPASGGVEQWSQDYLTDGSSLSAGESLTIQADSFGRDGNTLLGNVSGRFVRIQLLGQNNAGSNQLALSEVDITLFDENNLAVTDGIASQSSTETGRDASLASDGDPLTHSATLTSGTNSWWQTRLSQPFSIGQIGLVNHDDSNFAELSNFTVSVWDDNPDSGGNKLWEKAYFASGSVGRGEALVIDGSEFGDGSSLRLATAFTGKYVRVQLNGTNNAGNGRLSLAEVRVAPSSAAKPVTNLAQFGVASQSSNFYGDTATYVNAGLANAAIDGLVAPQTNFTTTLPTSGAWWQVDLGQASSLDQLVVVNRVDVANRLGNFRVSVWSDDPTNGGSPIWDKAYDYSSGASTYSTSAIGAGGALIINGTTTGTDGNRLDQLDNARFVRVQLAGSNFLSLVEVQAWTPTPPSSAGTIELNASSYAVDQQVQVTVNDFNAPSTITVLADNGAGETLPLTLSRNNGVYTGSFTLVGGPAGTNQLSVTPGESFTVSYVDADNGSGQSSSVLASASVADKIIVSATDLEITISNSQLAVSTLQVPNTGLLETIEVELDINHDWNSDQIITLVAPNGERITLIDQVGGSSDDFIGTVLAMDATVAIANGSAPYTGRFQPSESFDQLVGAAVQGDWRLEIEDVFNADNGTLNGWTLTLTTESTDVDVDLSQTIYQYDLGPVGSNVFSGYTGITPVTSGDIYWSGSVESADRGTGGGANDINRDLVFAASPTTFGHKIADGIWRVTLNMGDSFLHDQMGVRAEGALISDSITSPAGQFSYVDQNGASATPTSFEVVVTDGELNLEFFDDGGGDVNWVLNRVVLQRIGDLAPPEVVASSRDGGSLDGSGLVRPDQIETLTVSFDQDVNIVSGDLALVNDTQNGSVVDTSQIGFSYDAANFIATWDFTSLPNALPASFYTYDLSTSVTGVAGGQPVAGNGGGNFSESIYVALVGDTDLDGDVDILQSSGGDGFTLLASIGLQTGATWADGDFNGDGDVDIIDASGGDGFGFLANLGVSVVPAAASLVTVLSDSSSATPVVVSNEAIAAVDDQPSIVSPPVTLVSAPVLPEVLDIVSEDANSSAPAEPVAVPVSVGALSLSGDYDVVDEVFGGDGWL